MPCRATDAARQYCLRAYELDRADKGLYYVWPRVEAAAGDVDRARVLFERGLELHPMNTKIMNVGSRRGDGWWGRLRDG